MAVSDMVRCCNVTDLPMLELLLKTTSYITLRVRRTAKRKLKNPKRITSYGKLGLLRLRLQDIVKSPKS